GASHARFLRVTGPAERARPGQTALLRVTEGPPPPGGPIRGGIRGPIRGGVGGPLGGPDGGPPVPAGNSCSEFRPATSAIAHGFLAGGGPWSGQPGSTAEKVGPCAGLRPAID